MGTCSFRVFIMVCKKMGLVQRKTGNSFVWAGIDPQGEYRQVSIHVHVEGRDIPSGTFNKIVKDLGFANEEDFFKFLDSK
ncbi:MAG: hypothetical protein VR69_16290 [Peptococcaceae bacterium BRH_c4b]|nr:MAG: hypothetical protein VR69_16290 [Peptococcaceae bacterium BRH_c4b]